MDKEPYQLPKLRNAEAKLQCESLTGKHSWAKIGRLRTLLDQSMYRQCTKCKTVQKRISFTVWEDV